MDNILKAGRFKFDLRLPKIMGILNLTPDSFSDGGKYFDTDIALVRVQKMIDDGVDIIDIGAESTRPNADYIDAKKELSRLNTIVKEIINSFNICISIDTYKTEVMKEMVDLGVDMINDVSGFQDKGALELLSKTDLALCIMHSRGNPKTMQNLTHYDDLILEVKDFLYNQASLAINLGIEKERICIDPGFGFAKTFEQNLELVKQAKILSEQFPILFGVSKKGSIGNILGDKNADRSVASTVLSLIAIQNGASIVRVHDVKAMCDAIKVYESMNLNDLHKPRKQ